MIRPLLHKRRPDLCRPALPPGLRSRGFTLLEVLIALVVLAFGILGIAAMQTLALTGSQGGYLRTQATLLAYDMVDRMRANERGVGEGLYDNIPETPGTKVACSPCTAEQIRDNDRYWWNTNIANLLPNGAGTVTSDDTETFTITITWTDRGVQEQDHMTQQLVLTVRL